jgi:2-methylisocitrate lyase-like PEP mutase family enzyme
MSPSTNGADSSTPPTTAATKLRRMISDPNGFVFAPGVYDGFSARIALGVGFDCLYMVHFAFPSNSKAQG